MSVKKEILLRAWFSFALVALLAIGIIWKVISIQVYEGPELRKMADNSDTKFFTITSARGNIYADDGSLLATSIPIYQAHFDPTVVNEKLFTDSVRYLAKALASFLKDSGRTEYTFYQELVKARKEKNQYFKLASGLTHSDLRKLKTFPILRRGQYKGGLMVLQSSRRILPYDKLARRTIGYYKVGTPAVGLEGSFNHFLAGKEGRRLMQKVGVNKWLPINDENEEEPQEGYDIHSTINVNFQDIAHSALEKQLIESKAKGGCVVVMEVATGQIKALANLTKHTDGRYYEGFNYAVGQSSEQGSTIKLATVMALMEEGWKPDHLVNAKGGQATFYGTTFTDSDTGIYLTTLSKAFAKSSNAAISQAAFDVFHDKPNDFVAYFKKFGLGTPTNIPILGEGQPVMHQVGSKYWSRVSLPSMALGYSMQLTPLQLLTFYNTVANNGFPVKPLIVSKVEDAGRLVSNYRSEPATKRICSESTINYAKGMLVNVVEYGTANKIKSDLYGIAGKTGTARIAYDSSGYGGGNSKKEHHQSSFCGFFPARAPKYSMIVVIYEPAAGNAYYAAAIAAPVFKTIADKIQSESSKFRLNTPKQPNIQAPAYAYASHLSEKHFQAIQSQLDNSTSSNNATPAIWNLNYVTPIQKGASTTAQVLKSSNNVTPDIRGMLISDAMPLLENLGWYVRFSGVGRVVQQTPEPGTSCQKGDIMQLILK